MSGKGTRDEGSGPFLFDPLPDDESAPEPVPPQPEGPPEAEEDPGVPAPAAEVESVPGRRPQQILFDEPESEDAAEVASPFLGRRRRRALDPNRVSPLARLTSGLLDLAAMLAAALVTLLGLDLLGVEPRFQLLPGVLLFVVIFSFVYHVFSLLFWGRTPGMGSADLVTCDPSGQSLTAWQSTLRWAGSLGTVLFGGVPMIVSWFTGWSLADLVSGSETRVGGN